MKAFFAITFAVLILLSGVAWWIQPERRKTGKTPLVWCSDDNPARREQISLFNKLYPAYELKLDPGNMELQKIIVQSIGGVGPDLFNCYSGSQLVSYVKSGIAWDLTDEFKKRGIDIKKEIWPCSYPHVIYEGRIYGYPTNAGTLAIWFNKELFDKAGVPYPRGPWKWKEFIPVAKKMTVRGPDGRVKQFGFMYETFLWEQFVRQWGGQMYTDDGTRCIIDSPEAVAAIQFMHDLIYRYRVCPSPAEQASMAAAGGWGNGSMALFAANKIAMITGGRWCLCLWRGEDYRNKLKLGAAECPYERHRVFIGLSKGTLINKNSPRRKEALDFVFYQRRREYNELINHQADALAPVRKYCQTDTFLHDPEFPEEDYNDVWRDSMSHTIPQQISPFVKVEVVERIMNKQLDLVLRDQKSAKDAMRTAAREINAAIQESLEEDPSLKARYRQLVAE